MKSTRAALSVLCGVRCVVDEQTGQEEKAPEGKKVELPGSEEGEHAEQQKEEEGDGETGEQEPLELGDGSPSDEKHSKHTHDEEL